MFALANLAIARLHAERDIVGANPSVRPSVTFWCRIYANADIVKLFRTFGIGA